MEKKLSPAELLAGLSAADRAAVLAGLSPAERAALAQYWRFVARPDQLAPPFEWWRVWLFCAGRGSGKTRSGAEWVREEIKSGRRRAIGAVGPTADAVRRVMIEGPSGILACSTDEFRGDYEPSTRRVRFPNGAMIHLFSAEEPERLRGPNLDGAWCDELAVWSNADAAWSNLQLALRVPGTDGAPPRCMVSTTPRRTPLIRALIADAEGENPSVVVTRASTFDNAANLDPATLEHYRRTWGGTHLARQELYGDLLADEEDALWSRALIDKTRATVQRSQLERVVVGVDPSGGTGRGSGECGIVVAGRIGAGIDAHGYILADLSGKYSADTWARKAVGAYRAWGANEIVAEGNFGREMVRHTLSSVDPNVPIKIVNAANGKYARAEPVVARYEQGRVHHTQVFPELEDQMCSWVPDGSMPSPDRLDASVWACTALLIEPQAKPARWGQFVRRV